eukprot:sb/3475042/
MEARHCVETRTIATRIATRILVLRRALRRAFWFCDAHCDAHFGFATRIATRILSTRSTSVPDFFRLKYPKLSSVNANSKLRRRRISVFLPEVWNSLPLELRSVHPVELFKTRLKTRLFKEAFVDPDGSST